MIINCTELLWRIFLSKIYKRCSSQKVLAYIAYIYICYICYYSSFCYFWKKVGWLGF